MAVMANQACMIFDFFFFFIAWHFETTIAPEKHFRTFFVYVRLMVLELASLKKKKKKKKKEEERK